MPVVAQLGEIEGDHFLGREAENLIAVVGPEVRLDFVEVLGVGLHEVQRKVRITRFIERFNRVRGWHVDAQVQVGRVVAQVEGIDVQPTTVDRVSGVDGRPVPFTGQRDAVDHRFDDRTGRLIGERRVRPEVLQIGRQIEVDGAVDVGQVDLEQHVPHFVVAAVLVEAVPPVPVAAFGDVERFPREVKARIVRVVGLEGDQRSARLDEALPRQTLVGFTGPGAERPVDPRPRSDRFDAWQVRVVREELTRRGRDHGGVGREP